MFKKQNYFALGAMILAVLLIFNLPAGVTSRLKLAAGSLFSPLFGLKSAAQTLPVSAADAVIPRRELLQQLENLRRENEQLKVQALQSAATTKENDQLHALLGWQKQVPWKLKLAKVVGRDPANWWHMIEIDLGSRDGLTNNLPVLTVDGLVGRVSFVGLTRSQVVLLGDPNCKASALVENAAHDMGVITASGPLDNSLVELTYLAGSADLKAGQNVVTSGLGGIFPKDIPIGQIVDAQPVEFGLYTEARVKLAANLGALEQVWVLFP
ncbi:MAG TPA: rod shape-determining protein MreC [Verrucomicrobiae bacterium]|nr:rod shape-determining protein MreC [Verrucomicrobiae bacterium]